VAVTYEGATEQARQVIHHHAVLRRGLERRAGTLCEAVENGIPFERQMTILRDYLAGEILPHAEAEERTLYRAAVTQARGGELVRELTGEHHALAYLAGRLRVGADGSQAATAAEWIATLFAGHVAKVNDLLLPALTNSGADLMALLADMHAPQPTARALRHRHRHRRRAGHRGPQLSAVSLAARHHGGGGRRGPGSMSHPGATRRPAATPHVRRCGCRGQRRGNGHDGDGAFLREPAVREGSGLSGITPERRPWSRAAPGPGQCNEPGPGMATDKSRTATRRTGPHDHLEV
jgi:hypothetical protein